MAFREASADETRLIHALIARAAGLKLPLRRAEGLRVEEMGDGGMGSLRLSFSGAGGEQRVLHHVGAEVQFTDADGVEVIASLHVDADGVPFELDVWKTDFGPLIHIPDPLPAADLPA